MLLHGFKRAVKIIRKSMCSNLNFSFSELELPEDDRAVGAGTPCEYIESPMSDGTIEEDFEKALAREVADRR